MSPNTEYAIVIEAGLGKGRFGPDIDVTTYPSYDAGRSELDEIVAGRRPQRLTVDETATAVELSDGQFLIVDKKKLGSHVLARLSLGRVSARHQPTER